MDKGRVKALSRVMKGKAGPIRDRSFLFWK